MIPLKSQQDIEMIKKSGHILARLVSSLSSFAKEGVSTGQIDNLAAELMREEGVASAFKDYKGFPAHICTSVNEEIVHGIPGPRVLRNGDILGIDAGINYQGYISDIAITVAIGRVSPNHKKLIDVAKGALAEGIKKTRKGNRLSDISYAIQSYVEAHGFSVVRDFVGHGVGYSLHEEPGIPNFGRPHQGPLLAVGMVLAIEPMINLGSWESRILDNGWTAVTKDGTPSAHFEHTVAVTNRGPQILTN